MKSKNYKILVSNLDARNEQEMLTIVNGRIDNIILESSSNPKDTLEALICIFESNNNLSSYYAIMTIAYSLLVAVLSLAPSIFASTIVQIYGINQMALISAGLAICAIFLLVVIANKDRNKSEKKAFILSVLRFRYDKINQKTDPLDCNIDEKEYVVKVKKKN